jgi:hypothetical protein
MRRIDYKEFGLKSPIIVEKMNIPEHKLSRYRERKNSEQNEKKTTWWLQRNH